MFRHPVHTLIERCGGGRWWSVVCCRACAWRARPESSSGRGTEELIAEFIRKACLSNLLMRHSGRRECSTAGQVKQEFFRRPQCLPVLVCVSDDSSKLFGGAANYEDPVGWSPSAAKFSFHHFASAAAISATLGI